MAKRNGNGANLGQQLTNGLMATLASAGIDGLVETAQLPFLNDPAPIGERGNLSMSELLLYGSGAVLFTFGLFSFITKKKILGLGPDSVGTGGGAIAGTWLWNNYISQAVGVRK